MKLPSHSRHRGGWSLACLLVAIGLAPSASQAQSAGAEWRAFLNTQPAPPATPGVVPDEAFERLREPGDWTRAVPAARPAAWHALLQSGQWPQALDMLRRQGGTLDPNLPVGTFGPTPLVMAVQAGQVELVRELIKRGADVDVVSGDGFTPLGAAGFRGDAVLVKVLLKAGAKPSVVGASGQTALHLASLAGRSEAVRLLWPVSDPLQPNAQGRHAFAEAAFHGQLAVMAQMAGAGFDPATPALNGLDAMHASVLGRQAQAMAWLRDRGLVIRHPITDVLMAQWQEGLDPLQPR